MTWRYHPEEGRKALYLFSNLDGVNRVGDLKRKVSSSHESGVLTRVDARHHVNGDHHRYIVTLPEFLVFLQGTLVIWGQRVICLESVLETTRFCRIKSRYYRYYTVVLAHIKDHHHTTRGNAEQKKTTSKIVKKSLINAFLKA